MRLDYTLYVLAALLFIITAVPFVAPIGVETTETKSLWVVATVVLGLLSIGLGYSQRPKTAAQACQPVVTMPTTTVEAPEEKPEAPVETVTVEKAATAAAPVTTTIDLTQVKGIGEKRTTQLKAIGINNVDDLAKASAAAIAKKLQISSKITKKWVASAKKLVK